MLKYRVIDIPRPEDYTDIPFDKLKVDERLKLRETLNERKVEEYAEILQDDPASMAPVVVGYTDHETRGPFYLVDGFHRLEAQKRAGFNKAFVEKKFYSSFEDMFEEAFRRNDSHGLQLTPSEKRKALETIMLAHPEETIFELAIRCGVGKSTIGNLRKELSASGKYKPDQTCKGKDGKERPLTYASREVKPPKGGESLPEGESVPNVESTADVQRMVTCATCGKSATLEEASHFKSTWEPDSSTFDVDSGRYKRWYCCEQCQEKYLEKAADDYLCETHEPPWKGEDESESGHGVGETHEKSETSILESFVVFIKNAPSDFFLVDINGSLYTGFTGESLAPVTMSIGDVELPVNDENVKRLYDFRTPETLQEFENWLGTSLYESLILGPLVVDEVELVIREVKDYYKIFMKGLIEGEKN